VTAAAHKGLAGRCALVTGSAAGLGYAMAEALAAHGASVVLHGLPHEAGGQEAARRLRDRHGVPALWLPADLAQPTQIEAMAGEVRRAIGPVDILVNNAVVRHVAPAHELALAQWNEALAVNLSAAFHLAHLTLPEMRARRWGRIVNMSSVYGARGAAERIGYVTTKTALLGLTRVLAIEGAPYGITCNAVAPGTAPTPAIVDKIAGIARAQGVSPEQAEHAYLSQRQPTGRFVAMESVAALVAFLCGDAGQDITGAVLPVDGGWTAA